MIPMRKSLPLDPTLLRRSPQEGQGWTRDEDNTPRRWDGCDCCGKGPLEVPAVYRLRNQLLGARWLVCSRCCAALTGAGQGGFWTKKVLTPVRRWKTIREAKGLRANRERNETPCRSS